jgi:hypothetical protein
MGTTVYNSHQGLRFALLWLYEDRLDWESIGNRKHSSPQLTKSSLH